MSAMIRIVMADDHEIFRDGFAAMFRSCADIELVDQAPNGQFLLALVKRHLPDVVLTDIQMDPVDGIEVTRQISRQFPGMPVIALSMFGDNYSIMEMLQAGAMGYLLKNAGKEVVMEAIRSAYRGEPYYCRTASQKLSALIASGRFDPRKPETVDFNPTELRIIRMICEDMESQQIAEQLNCSLGTVNKYRARIMEKAGVKSTTGLIVYAMRNGVVRV